MADTSAGEPRRIIPALGPFYDQTRDLSWLIVRLTAGGFLLIHGLQKLFNATFTVWAANVLSKARHRAGNPARHLCVVHRNGRRGLHHARPLYARVRGNGRRANACDHLLRALGRRICGLPLEPPDRRLGVCRTFWGCILLAIGLRGGGPYSLDRKLGREL